MPTPPFLLFAEDNQSIRRLFADALAKQGYAVLEAENGRIAFDLFLAHRDSIQLLVTDGSMPEMSGSELIAQVRCVAPAMPVLVISTTGASYRQAQGLGANIRFLDKPFLLEAFKRTVQEMWDAAASENLPAGSSRLGTGVALPRFFNGVIPRWFESKGCALVSFLGHWVSKRRFVRG